MMIVVTNKGRQDFVAGFDGVKYGFPGKGGKTIVTKEVVQHIFGIGNADKTGILARHGWLTSSADMDKAMSRLAAFAFATLDETEQATPVAAQEQGSAPLQAETVGLGGSDGLIEPTVEVSQEV